MSQNMKQCYDLLNTSGRAFEVSMNHLDDELRDAMCLHYLALPAVDTIEDDMTIPSDIKVTMLTSFGKYLLDPTWKYSQSNDEYAVVLDKFPCIAQALRELPSKYRDIILELGTRIGQGMAKFVGQELTTIEDMNEYCRHVATVFCTGIARLFVASGLETEMQDTALVVNFSIFLHKTNIIRHFRKDWQSSRLYYTKDVWSKYVSNPGDFLEHENTDEGVECVNELITEALQHTMPYLHFIKGMRSPSAIKFFGIHQLMAIATLECCYNNPRVFMESVKIGRDETMEIIKSASCLGDIIAKNRHYTERIMEHARQAKGTSQSTLNICRQILNDIQLLESN